MSFPSVIISFIAPSASSVFFCKINRLEKQITQLQNAPRAVASSSTSQESKTQYAIKPEVKKSTSIKLGDKVHFVIV